MGLWDDLARLDLQAEDSLAFDDFGMDETIAGPIFGGSDDVKKVASLSDAKTTSEGAKTGSKLLGQASTQDGRDASGALKNSEGLRGGSESTLGRGDEQTTAQNAARDAQIAEAAGAAQAKVTADSATYNNTILGFLPGDAVAATEAQGDPDKDNIGDSIASLETWQNDVNIAWV